MTRKQWLKRHDPWPMYRFARAQMSARKHRLFFVGCCRRIKDPLIDPETQHAVDVAERFADGQADEAALALARVQVERVSKEADDLYNPPGDRLNDMRIWAAVAAGLAIRVPSQLNDAVTLSDFGSAAQAVYHSATRQDPSGLGVTPQQEFRQHAALLRCIVGNPFRPVAFDFAWRTSDVVLLARGIYEERAFDRMPILADALQDAGCDSADILSHCRDANTPHARGCWVVDLVMGKA